MKRKKNNILMFVITAFIILNNMIPCESMAISTIDIKSNKKIVELDEQIELTLDLRDSNIAAYTIYLYYDTTKLQYVNSPENSNNINHIIVHTGVKDLLEENENIEIGPFVFKAISDNTITSVIVTGEFYKQNGEKIDIENGMIELQLGKEQQIQTQTLEENVNQIENIEKDNTNLSILRLNKPGITPEFSKEIKEYYFLTTENVSELEVTAIPENTNASVKVRGNYNLKEGTNTIEIEVESEDKSKKEVYNIYVTKTDDVKKANTNLENLAIRQGTLNPDFDANITQYTVDIANQNETIDILAVPENINATVEIKKEDTLIIGDNKIDIIITAEDGKTKKRYQIIAHRRNLEEEIKYEEEQEEQLEQLNIILKQTATTEQEKEITNDSKQENIIMYIIIASAILGSLSITVLTIKKKQDNKKQGK